MESPPPLPSCAPRYTWVRDPKGAFVPMNRGWQPQVPFQRREKVLQSHRMRASAFSLVASDSVEQQKAGISGQS